MYWDLYSIASAEEVVVTLTPSHDSSLLYDKMSRDVKKTQEEVDCDPRFSEIESGYDPTGYEPRCRPWYQSAIDSSINSDGGVVFTNPYIDATSGTLIVSVGAPVYNVTDPTLLLGVVGIDVNVADIKESIENWAVVGDEGYAYILAPGVEGEVMVHQDLREEDGTKLIGDLDVLDEAEFGKILIKMSENCTGSEIYMNDGAPWLLSWDHETASGGVSTDGEIDCLNGFIIVTTVSESALLKVSALLRNGARGRRRAFLALCGVGRTDTQRTSI